jgi:hypothetical protein
MQTQFNRVKPNMTKYSKTMVPKIVAMINNMSTMCLSFGCMVYLGMFYLSLNFKFLLFDISLLA